MNKFGVIKTKILDALTESYAQDKKSEIKNILNVIKENKDFKEMYLFYEEIENKYIDDKEIAKLYVEEVTNLLKTKIKNLSEFCQVLNTSLGKRELGENPLYSILDQLSEEDSLNNIDKKVIAKRKLIEHLTTKKEVTESFTGTYTENENLLHTILANNFNVIYSNSLNEEQKNELKEILSLSEEEIEIKTKELKEEISGKLNTIITETNSTETEILNKLIDTKHEVDSIPFTKYSYYRLKQLKNGLN